MKFVLRIVSHLSHPCCINVYMLRHSDSTYLEVKAVTQTHPDQRQAVSVEKRFTESQLEGRRRLKSGGMRM